MGRGEVSSAPRPITHRLEPRAGATPDEGPPGAAVVDDLERHGRRLAGGCATDEERHARRTVRPRDGERPGFGDPGRPPVRDFEHCVLGWYHRSAVDTRARITRRRPAWRTALRARSCMST